MNHTKGAEKLAPIPKDPAQFNAETLRRITFEVISRLYKVWSEYKDRKENRLKIFNLGRKLHGLLVESIKVDPDIMEIKKLREVYEQFEEEYEIFKRQNLQARKPPPKEENKNWLNP